MGGWQMMCALRKNLDNIQSTTCDGLHKLSLIIKSFKTIDLHKPHTFSLS